MNKMVDIIEEDAERICRGVDFSDLKGKSVLITGASGLLGIHLIASLRHLSKKGNGPARVIAIVRSNPLPYQTAFFKDSPIELHQGDLTDSQFCAALPKVDYIIHSAGYGQPVRFMQNPIETIQINTSATLSLFERLLPGGKFLFVSTAEVYSGLGSLFHRETEIGTTNTTHPRACYIEAKRCGEAICNSYRSLGVDAKSARLALAYGPGTKPGDKRVLNSFIEKGLNGKINLLDQGLAKRTYCYVTDAVDIIWNILLFGTQPIYNVGGDSRTTIRELAEHIGKILNVPIIFPAESDQLEGAPADVQLDMSLVKAAFGKTDFISFEEGLSRTIDWQSALYQTLAAV